MSRNETYADIDRHGVNKNTTHVVSNHKHTVVLLYANVNANSFLVYYLCTSLCTLIGEWEKCYRQTGEPCSAFRVRVVRAKCRAREVVRVCLQCSRVFRIRVVLLLPAAAALAPRCRAGVPPVSWITLSMFQRCFGDSFNHFPFFHCFVFHSFRFSSFHFAFFWRRERARVWEEGRERCVSSLFPMHCAFRVAALASGFILPTSLSAVWVVIQQCTLSLYAKCTCVQGMPLGVGPLAKWHPFFPCVWDMELSLVLGVVDCEGEPKSTRQTLCSPLFCDKHWSSLNNLHLLHRVTSPTRALCDA